MDPFAIKPLPRVLPEIGRAAPEQGVGATAFVLHPGASAEGDERKSTQERADDLSDAAQLLALPGEERLVVRFEPVAMREGQVLVVAHVVSARLSELCASAEQMRQSRARASLPPAIAEVNVELQAEDAFSGRARVHVAGGALGPMTLELRLARGRLEVHAHVGSARAAEALTSDQALLERALRLQGVELGSLSVEIERRSVRPKAGKNNRRDTGKRKEG